MATYKYDENGNLIPINNDQLPPGMIGPNTDVNIAGWWGQGSGGQTDIFGGKGGGIPLGWLSKVPWGKVAKGIPLLGSLFARGNKDDANMASAIGDVRASAGQLSDQGAQLSKMGSDALAPALHFFSTLASGDPAAIASITAPDRARVIDQYDTAKRSAATFAPRGGGLTSSFANLGASEARDLSVLSQGGRSQGASALSQIGEALTQQGVGAKEGATNALAQILYPLIAQGQNNTQKTKETFAGLGALIGAIYNTK